MRSSPESFHAIGIDVGGTKIAAGWVSFPEATIHARRLIPTSPDRGAPLLDEVLALAIDLAAAARNAGADINTIGLGLCELVSPTGRILSDNSISWRDLPVVPRLAAIAPAWLDADVRAAARAEAMFGAGRGLEIFLYVTVGTGIASSLVIRGEPFLGAHGATGTMASSPIRFPCERCGHPNRQTLEAIAAGPGLVRQLNQLRPDPVANGQAALAAAAEGDPAAQRVVTAGAEALESVVGLLINVLDPQAVIVGGGLGLSEGPFWDRFTAATLRHVWSGIPLPILRAGTGSDAGWLGAAASAWRKSTPGL
jgi:glucokinase